TARIGKEHFADRDPITSLRHGGHITPSRSGPDNTAAHDAGCGCTASRRRLVDLRGNHQLDSEITGSAQVAVHRDGFRGSRSKVRAAPPLPPPSSSRKLCGASLSQPNPLNSSDRSSRARRGGSVRPTRRTTSSIGVQEGGGEFYSITVSGPWTVDVQNRRCQVAPKGRQKLWSIHPRIRPLCYAFLV
ncbi:uncharacterized protein MYCGRDRAFT_106684, partial [Zymoseptoria tritici IPO323]